jgi:hypothetical protein
LQASHQLFFRQHAVVVTLVEHRKELLHCEALSLLNIACDVSECLLLDFLAH